MATTKDRKSGPVTGIQTRRDRGLRAPAAVISDAVEFAALNSGKREIVQGPVEGESDGLTGGSNLPAGIVTHNRTSLVRMYKPDGRGHFSPRSVPNTAIQQNLLNGWAAHCPECGGDHGSNPNDCAARDATAVRICPVCGKRIYDNRNYETVTDDEDPNVIHDEHDVESTPASRTLAARNLHMRTRHPQEARELGLAPLPEPSQTVMDAVGA